MASLWHSDWSEPIADVIIQICYTTALLVIYWVAHTRGFSFDRPLALRARVLSKLATRVQPVDHAPPSYNIYMDYRDRLLNLNILPLMMQYEISDIMFLVKCIKNPSNYFNISEFVLFSSSNTRSSAHLKLKHSIPKNNTLRQFYFNRIPRLWNSLPRFDLDLSIGASYNNSSGTTSFQISIQTISVLIIICVHAVHVQCSQSLYILIIQFCKMHACLLIILCT